MDILSLTTDSTTTSSSSQEGKVADVAISNSTPQKGLCENCNMPRHFRAKDCTQMCRLCPGLAPHKYYQPEVCRKYFTMKAKKQKDGTWVEPKRAHNANKVRPPSVDPEDWKLLATLKGMLKQVSHKKGLLLDSG